MKTLSIARMEFRSKLWLLGLSLAVGLLAWATPLLKAPAGAAMAESRAAISAIYALGTLVAVAVLLGAGLVGPDLQEGRMSFYFARPLAPRQLLGGRLLNALLMTLLCTAIVGLPTVATQGASLEVVRALWPLAILAAILILAGHAASIALRALTSWLLLDVAILVLGPALFAWLAWRLFSVWAARSLELLLAGALTMLVLTLLMAAFAQVSFGRTDLRRSHRVLSLSLAAGFLLAAAGGVSYVAEVLRVDGAEIRRVIAVDGGTRGPWVEVLGTLEGGKEGEQTYLLLNSATGRGQRLPMGGAAFSRDGLITAWWAPSFMDFRGEGTLMTADLRGVSLRVKDTGIRVSAGLAYRGGGGPFAVLSPEGSRIAFLEGNVLVVHDLTSGVGLFRQPLRPKAGSLSELVFFHRDHLRVYEREPDGTQIAIFEVDLAKNRMIRAGGFDVRGFNPIQGLDATGGAMLTKRSSKAGVAFELRDARTGALVKTLMEAGTTWNAKAVFLAGGGIASLEVGEEGAIFRVLDEYGVETWRARLPVEIHSKPDTSIFCLIGLPSSPQSLPLHLVWNEGGVRGVRKEALFSVDLVTRTFIAQDADAIPLRPTTQACLSGPPAPGGFLSTLSLTRAGVLRRREGQGAWRAVTGAR